MQAYVDAAPGAREAVPARRLPGAALQGAAGDAPPRGRPPGGPAPRRLQEHGQRFCHAFSFLLPPASGRRMPIPAVLTLLLHCYAPRRNMLSCASQAKQQ